MIQLSAVEIYQSQKQTFLAKVTFDQVVNLFTLDDPSQPLEDRHQRGLNERRAGEVADYLLWNLQKGQQFVLPPIVASLDGNWTFEEGQLSLEEDFKLLINDGQHRCRGIEIAVNENEGLSKQEVGVWLIPDVKLKEAQQIFSDINRNAKPTNKSLNLVFDHRSGDVALTKSIRNKIALFEKFTELEKAHPGKGKLFVFVALHRAICELNEALVNKGILGIAQTPVLITFWNVVAGYIPEWNFVSEFMSEAGNSEIALQSLHEQIEASKKNTISFHSSTLIALGKLGAEVIKKSQGKDWYEVFDTVLKPLESFNWHKDNPELISRHIVIYGAKDKLRIVNAASARQSLLELLEEEIGLKPKQLSM